MKKFKLIANPAAARGRANSTVRRVLAAMTSRTLEFDLEFTRRPKDAARIAREDGDGYDAVVVIGGDGTVNDVLPGMLGSELPLGVIPAGSGNDFIKSLNIPNNIEKAVDILARGATKRIDLGVINGWYFANAVGFGFEAAVTRASYSINHSKRGLHLYICALLKTLGRYDPVPMTVKMDAETMSREIFMLSIGNGTTVGGGFRLTPHARIDDGLLDITLIHPIGLLPLLWHLPKVFLGTIDRAKNCAQTARTAKLTVESDAPVPVHVDGELYPGNEKRFVIEVLPKALTVIGGF